MIDTFTQQKIWKSDYKHPRYGEISKMLKVAKNSRKALNMLHYAGNVVKKTFRSTFINNLQISCRLQKRYELTDEQI